MGYSKVAMVLHWLIASLLLFQLLLGWRVNDFDGAQRSVMLQLHKSVGLSILLLMIARLAWRAAKPVAPAEGLTVSERRLSHLVHIGFYIALIALPLSGWALVSLARGAPLFRLFGVVPWPQLPFLSMVRGPGSEILAGSFEAAHAYLAWITLVLITLHVAGALKHQLISRDQVLERMFPSATRSALRHPALVIVPTVALLVAGGASAFNPPETTSQGPGVKRVEDADLYRDVVAPTLSRRCESCHSADTPRGGFSVSSYSSLLAGGASGPEIRPGDSAHSELIRRVNLPSSDRHAMPADGRPPLSPEAVRLIAYWIQHGATDHAPMRDASLSPAVKADLGAALGLSQAAGAQADNGPDPDPVGVGKPDPQSVMALERAGFVVRPATKMSVLVDVVLNRQQSIAADDFALLSRLNTQIRRLDLKRSGLTDDLAKGLAGFPNLSVLVLTDNPITDAALTPLLPSKRLRVLNLEGTKVTAAGLRQVAAGGTLRSLYVWNTPVTDEGITQLRMAFPNIRIVGNSAFAAAPASSPGTP